jgi:excisionase family DNA binding protein
MQTSKFEIPILDEIKMRLENIELNIDSIINQKSHPKQDWLTTAQAAKYIGVTTRTLQTYRDLKHVRFSQFGREVRYKSSDLEAFLMDHYVKF